MKTVKFAIGTLVSGTLLSLTLATSTVLAEEQCFTPPSINADLQHMVDQHLKNQVERANAKQIAEQIAKKVTDARYKESKERRAEQSSASVEYKKANNKLTTLANK